MLKLNQVLAAVLATSAVGLAAAQEATTVDTTFVSTKSRAEVRAEALNAPQGGEVTVFADQAAPSAKSRAQVADEARQALRLGQIPHGEATLVAARTI